MAINIFSGNATRSSGKVNSALSSSRAQAAKEAVGGNAVVSQSGNTAVKAPGTLGKIANTVGEIAGIASKFLPGIGGTIASGLANVLNDPEWWQSIPGEQIALNAPLRMTDTGKHMTSNPHEKIYAARGAIAEFISGVAPNEPADTKVIIPTPNMITQYLMPQIRKVNNAIPLQSAEDYMEVFASHATVYAIWRQLKKCDYLLKHGQTYLPNMNDAMFPIFKVENAAWLQSTINRLEEYLRANVRLPHTLCEYLAWRYGRTYRSLASAKAGLIMYNAIGLNQPVSVWQSVIDAHMKIPSSTEAKQKANSDLYNAYFDHDLMVEIKDETQLTYDPKEFALRTNCDVGYSAGNWTSIPVYLDSALDNATVFMSSTVSTVYSDSGETIATPACLFPIALCQMYLYSDGVLKSSLSTDATIVDFGWNRYLYYGSMEITSYISTGSTMQLALCKALDIYNKNFVLRLKSGSEDVFIDLTQPSYDMATTTDTVIGNEQVFAFANLVNVDRKRSMTIGAADKIAAASVANLVDKVDVATAATK